jgi:hypothetical protein
MCTTCLVHFLFNLLNLLNIYFEESGLGSYIFPSSRASRPALWPTQPPIQSVPEALSPGVERPGRKADHSLSSSAGVNDKCSYTSVPPYAFTAYIQTCPLPFEIIKPRNMQLWSPVVISHLHPIGRRVAARWRWCASLGAGGGYPPFPTIYVGCHVISHVDTEVRIFFIFRQPCC